MSSWTLETRVIDLPLAERFTIARETWDVARNVFVKVGFGHDVGFGEVQPAGRWDETIESVLEQLNDVDLERLRGPFDLATIEELLPPGSARSALDIALHDLAGRRAGIQVRHLLGAGEREPGQTSVTIAITDADAMRAKAEALRDTPVIKTKVGFDGDVEAIAAIRSVFSGKLRIDANEGWDEEEAIDRLHALQAYDIELCEQPIKGGDLEALARVTEASAIPIYADEDVGTAHDVVALRGVVDGVNLKLRKAGGIRELVRAIGVARAQRMGVMIGCDLESGVAASAGAHIAPLVDHVDMDGPLLLAEDPHPGVAYRAGNLVLPDRPGLGLEVDPW